MHAHKTASFPRRRAIATLLGHRAGRLLAQRRREQTLPIMGPLVSQAEQRRAAEIEHELRLARDIQQGLLLEAAPRLAGWEVTAVSLPARDLGGDLYDFLPLGDGWQGIMIGDVSGKGLPAALRMAVARTVFRHEARRNESPAPTLSAVNRGVLSEIPQGMVTMLFARLDPREGILRLANAGHTFPLIINGQVRELELPGLPLGVDSDSFYDEAATILGPGDSVILYTDGVIEAENPDGQIYGFERLQLLIELNCALKPRAMVQLLLRELRAWAAGYPQSDDVTVVVLRRRLAEIGAELRTVAEDVLGAARAAALWQILIEHHAGLLWAGSPEDWLASLPELARLVQEGFGRGLARELNQQFRLAIEDYR